ncbi:MAG TPA: PEP-CTERM sorting domain-containing protein [Sedimentisphaerales bacterium]|nr:PEP-CTERM sorting domain-containing protein [Sedimentisphaerales bacterium]
MDEDSHIKRAVTQRLVKGLGIGGLAIVASLGLASRVHATYFNLDYAPAYAERYTAGDYLDRGWYYLLDDGQYYYLDKGQYNLMGELGYLLGHPCYPKLYERDLDQAVGFTNRVNTGWFSFGGGQVPISEYAVWSYHFDAGDYIDRVRYYYLDNGRYYYLDRRQYNLLGGLGYSFGRPYYQKWYNWSYYQSTGQCAIPEPSTIGFLGLGALGVLVLRNKRRIGGAT